MGASAPLTTVKRHTLSNSVYDSVKLAIVSGHFSPGTRLTEQSLAEQLDVSRGPVREAISRLVHEGYLMGRPFEGYRVNRPTEEEIRWTYEILIGLTKTVIELALERIDEKQIAELLSLINTSEEALAEGDAEAYSTDVKEFRRRAAVYSQNRRLEELYEQYAYHPMFVQPWAVNNLVSIRRRAANPTALREAVRNRDGVRAGDLIADHLHKNLLEVLDELANSPSE